MYTKHNFTPQVLFLALLLVLVTACGTHTVFNAPTVEPSADLIPGYIPTGFKLISGFQMPHGGIGFSTSPTGEPVAVISRKMDGGPFFTLKSPLGNDIQGVHYENGDRHILITKSYFPDGFLELWRTTYEASWYDTCECMNLRPGELLPGRGRYAEVVEERTIGDTQIAILEGPKGWVTVFVRDDYLLSVESSISLEENLKIVASLLE